MTTKASRHGATNASEQRVKCPICGAGALFSPKNPFRPFCSEVCRNRDLAAWASDHYQIASSEARSSEDTEASSDNHDEHNNF